MKTLVFKLSILLAVLLPAHSFALTAGHHAAAECKLENNSFHGSVAEETSASFKGTDEFCAPELLVLLLDENDEDSNSTEKLPLGSKGSCLNTTASALHSEKQIRRPTVSLDRLPSFNFLSLRVLRL